MDNNRAIALGFGEWRFLNAALDGARTQPVFTLEMGATWKEAPLSQHRKGEEKFNLADGGTPTLRVSHSVMHTHSHTHT